MGIGSVFVGFGGSSGLTALEQRLRLSLPGRQKKFVEYESSCISKHLLKFLERAHVPAFSRFAIGGGSQTDIPFRKSTALAVTDLDLIEERNFDGDRYDV